MKTERLDTETRKEQIADAVLTVVGNQGLEALTMRRVARLVGIGPSALYRHFPGKAQMLEAALDTLARQFSTDVASALEGATDALDVLDRLLMLQVRRALRYRAIPRLLFADDISRDLLPAKNKIRGMLLGFIEGLAQVVRQGQEQGVLRVDKPPEALALMVLGVFQPSALMYHLSDGRFDIIGQVTASWEVLKGAIATQHSERSFT